MTYPSLQQHWQMQPQRFELIGVLISVEGEMIGFSVAECWQEGEQQQVELLSSYVLPAYSHHPIKKQIHRHLHQTVNHSTSNAQ